MRIYLIGAGVIAKEHANAINKLKGFEPIEVKATDINAQTLADFIELFPDITGYPTAAEMLSEPAMEDDIVIVCVPPFAHYDMSVLALQSGRHVVCEKPLTLNREQMESMFNLAESKNRYISCCSSRFVGLTKNEEIKRMLADGELGNVYKMNWISREQRGRPGIEFQQESRWFLDKSKSGGGVLMDWGPYDFALINHTLEPVKVEVLSAVVVMPETEIDPKDVVYNTESHVAAVLKYHLQDGKTLILNYERSSCMHGKAYKHMEIEGTKGAVEWIPYWEGDMVWKKTDQAGAPVVEEIEIKNEGNLGFHDLPLHYLYQHLRKQKTFLFSNEQAEFNFKCILDIYDAAANK